jgi:hypothetical protein
MLFLGKSANLHCSEAVIGQRRFRVYFVEKLLNSAAISGS